MKVFSTLRRWFRPSPRPTTGPVSSFDVEQFVYVKIPVSVGPIERGALFGDPIDLALAEGDLGEVSGGGSSLGEKQADGSRNIEFCGIDVDTRNRDGALAVLRELLPRLDAPMGTELHYTTGIEKLQDELSPEGWLLSRPRTQLHPGFDI